MSKAEEFINIVRAEDGIADAYLLSKSGEVIAKPAKSETRQTSTLASYLTLSAFEVGKFIGAKNPGHVIIHLGTDEKLLIIIGRSVHLVILLEYGYSSEELVSRLSAPLKKAVF